MFEDLEHLKLVCSSHDLRMASRLRASWMEARSGLIRPHEGSNPARSASQSWYTGCRRRNRERGRGQPAAFGGFDADFICQIDLTYEIAHACGASGWVYAVLSAHGAMIANFSERAQQEVWGDDPCALASSSLSSIGRFTLGGTLQASGIGAYNGAHGGDVSKQAANPWRGGLTRRPLHERGNRITDNSKSGLARNGQAAN
jgi:hypothetical protein